MGLGCHYALWSYKQSARIAQGTAKSNKVLIIPWNENKCSFIFHIKIFNSKEKTHLEMFMHCILPVWLVFREVSVNSHGSIISTIFIISDIVHAFYHKVFMWRRWFHEINCIINVLPIMLCSRAWIPDIVVADCSLGRRLSLLI